MHTNRLYEYVNLSTFNIVPKLSDPPNKEAIKLYWDIFIKFKFWITNVNV